MLQPHGTLTFRTNQKVHFVYLLNKACPAFSEGLHIPLLFDDSGDSVVVAFLLPFSPRDIAVNMKIKKLKLLVSCAKISRRDSS